ncbi:MAG: cupin domain-containing protein [Bdellovibrionales bacterium]|nr:cupin domain-containing protein [Bdellovibrionales bacterium]
MQQPDFIKNYKDILSKDDARYPESEELLSQGAPVGKALGLVKMGVHIEEIQPGRRTSWPHAEKDEEEFAFVIEGKPQVWIDGYVYDLVPGDFVAFPSGTGIAHTFINNSSQMVVLLVGGEASRSSNKVFYPLHHKRNQDMKEQGRLWEDAPQKDLGPHDGLPDCLREKVGPKGYL